MSFIGVGCSNSSPNQNSLEAQKGVFSDFEEDASNRIEKKYKKAVKKNMTDEEKGELFLAIMDEELKMLFNYDESDDIQEEEPIKKNIKKPKKSDKVLVEIIDKIDIPADIDNFEFNHRVNFGIEITNKTSKNIKGIQGILNINDLFGEPIMRVSCDLVGEIIESNKATINYDMGMSINEYIPKQLKVYNLDYDDLTFEYETLKIVFEDGTTEDY